jgi:hypothetical protein
MQIDKGFITDPKLIEALNNRAKVLALSKDEYIEGVRQVNEGIAKQKSQNAKEPGDVGWEGAAGYAACGFVRYYFGQFPEESPTPFLEMAADKNNDEDFRKAMLDILGDSDFYTLKKADIDTFSNTLLRVADDKSNSPKTREKAIRCLQRQLTRLETASKNDTQTIEKTTMIRDKAVQIKNNL